MRVIKRLLKFVAFCIVLVVVGTLLMIVHLRYSMHKLDRYAQQMHVGMSVREFVKAMPTDYFSAKVLRARRDVPCRGTKGEFVPSENDDSDQSQLADPSKPAQKASATEIAKLTPCPAVTFAHFRHTTDGKIYLEAERIAGGKVVTSDEFADFLEREFREGFYVGFTYTTITPQHQTFGVDFDHSGRIVRVVQPYGWD